MLRSSDAQPNTPVRNHTKNKKLTFSFGKKGIFLVFLVPFSYANQPVGCRSQNTPFYMYLLLCSFYFWIFRKNQSLEWQMWE